ncbi:MAG TPA: cytochrome c oxidase assembly protein [Aquamicrobium sp.]|nr:cytochrome c oxidase assembly protein [Aquamicrobium sp.]
MAQAYCGPAPVPDTLMTAWNADLAAAALCAALVAIYVHGGRRAGRLPLALAVAVLLVLFVSPFCALTVALFSARVAHHVVLVAVVAPLLALAFPERSAGRVGLAALVALHAATVWLWHAPAVYEIAIRGALPYWAMQLSLLGSAFLLWRRILSRHAGTGPALMALLATATQMGMLGALLTFARRPLYAPHADTTLAYGLTPLADQQLAGLVMWVPAALPYLLAAALLAGAWLERPSAPAGR